MNSKGFTLVEALLSIVIISIGTIFILQTFGWELTTLGVAHDNMRAALLLEEKMAEIEKEIIEKGNLELFPVSGKFSAAGEKDFSWTITLLPTAISEGLTEVRLGCFWKSKGKTQSMTLAALVREKNEE